MKIEDIKVGNIFEFTFNNDKYYIYNVTMDEVYFFNFYKGFKYILPKNHHFWSNKNSRRVK